MPIFSFGGESGGREAAAATRSIFKGLVTMFAEEDEVRYFETLHSFQIMLRTSGRTKDFGGEGPEFFKKRRLKGIPFYTIDLTVPEQRWREVDFEALKHYLLDGVESCFEIMFEYAQAANEIVDKNKLKLEFQLRIRKLRNAASDDQVFRLNPSPTPPWLKSAPRMFRNDTE